MPSTEVVMPLSGSEVVEDVLDQIRRKLLSDCNFRSADAYSGGYSGKIKIELKLYSVDSPSVEMEVQIGPPEPVAQEGDNPAPLIEVDAELVIAQETDLDAVRKRSEQGVPVQTLDPTTKQTAIKKRRYATAGAALDESEI